MTSLNASSASTGPVPNGSSTAPSTANSSVLVPTKSSGDDRSYRYLVLPNGLQVLLVHDGEADKASAAMDVGVGCWSDPDELPGLAHFLEHMVRTTLRTRRHPCGRPVILCDNSSSLTTICLVMSIAVVPRHGQVPGRVGVRKLPQRTRSGQHLHQHRTGEMNVREGRLGMRTIAVLLVLQSSEIRCWRHNKGFT